MLRHVWSGPEQSRLLIDSFSTLRRNKAIRNFITSVILVLGVFAAGTFAQDCETYDLHGVVTNEQGKPIKGAMIDLLDDETGKPITLDRWGNPMARVKSGRDGSYSLAVTSLPTYSERGDRRRYVVRATAAGFRPYEQRTDIELCGFKLDIKLAMTKRPTGKKERRSEK